MLKRSLWLLSGAFGIILIVLTIIWNKVTYLPSWYVKSAPARSVTLVNETKPQELARLEMFQKIHDTIVKQGGAGQHITTIEFSSDEISRLIFFEMQAVERFGSNGKLEKMIVGQNTQFSDGKLVVGNVVNLQELLKHKELQGGKRVDLAKIVLNLPIVKNPTVYIEVEGKPIVKNRKLALESPNIKLANVNMTVEELSKFLGISPAFINQRISREYFLVPMRVADVKIKADKMLMSGTGEKW